MFELVFDPEAIEFLAKLQKKDKERIFSKIQLTKENPLRFFERLKGREDFKLRVGDHRVIADIDQSVRRIQVTIIGHRKNTYKNLK